MPSQSSSTVLPHISLGAGSTAPSQFGDHWPDESHH
jgi:hypothetical protein